MTALVIASISGSLAGRFRSSAPMRWLRSIARAQIASYLLAK